MIEFNNVSFAYGDKNILKDITFTIEKGTWLTILGENGSGKSTLTKLIYGHNVATSGKISFNNKQYSFNILDEIREKVAIVFQNPDNQFVGSTVEEDIAFGLENKNIPVSEMEELIEEVLEVVGMKNYRKSEPSSLSGGQKQRVAIAANLALKPEVLILDEATSMLDPQARKSILKYIKKINKEKNITIISITHDVEETIYSDDILILNKGQIVYKGNYKELYSDNNTLEKYFLERPFLEKLKMDINDKLKQDILKIDDNEERVIEKLCALLLKT